VRRVKGRPGLERHLAHPLRTMHPERTPNAAPPKTPAEAAAARLGGRRQRRQEAAAEAEAVAAIAAEVAAGFDQPDPSTDINPILARRWPT
jgi:hypothetical protein